MLRLRARGTIGAGGGAGVDLAAERIKFVKVFFLEKVHIAKRNPKFSNRRKLYIRSGKKKQDDIKAAVFY